MYNTILTGVAILIPIVITLYVLRIAIDFVRDALNPFVDFLQWVGIIQRFERVEFISLLIDLGIYSWVIDFFGELVALIVLFAVIAVVGTVGRNQYGEKLIGVFDFVVSSIPGIGTVYKSFRRMGDVVLDEGAEEFQDVKLVQCFDENVYVLGFQTGDAPATIEHSTGHVEMVSMFLPLAPNPVTGGILTYIPKQDVYDIDMTVEEGIRSILTSGVATDSEPANMLNVDMADLRNSERFQDLREAMVTARTEDESDESQNR
ncbi:DUF502 domain-containing protein [Haloferax namakaokahaiae]|uniref:DUF502 domain-containing protein n=1 Tax=Haloferax namakaokahaiae TaxID=1748331 RepID=A0ABD5ZBM8_9EURY